MSEAVRGAHRLLPFRRELHPPGGAPLMLSGTIMDGHYRLSAERRGERYDLDLVATVERDDPHAVARVDTGVHPLGPGMWLTLERSDPSGDAAARGVTLSLRIETRSAAHDRGSAVMARLGGGPALARLLSPPRWCAMLGFDAQGRELRAPEGS